MAFSLCQTLLPNTGAIDCDVAPAIPRKVFIWNGTKSASAISGAAFQTFLEISSKLSKNAADKLFALPIIQDVVDNTEQDQTGTLNQGFSTILREGNQSFTFKVFAGLSLSKQLRKLNGKTVKALIQDSNRNVFGVLGGTNFYGYTVKLAVSGNKFGDGQAVVEGVVSITLTFLDPTELSDSAAYGNINSSAGVRGLLDVTLKEIAAKAANVYKIGGYIKSSEVGSKGIDTHDQYPTEFTATANWRAYTGTGYTTQLSVTSVANDAVNGGWTVTLDSTAHTALPANAKILITWAPPEILDAAGIAEVEAIGVEVIKS